MKHSQKYLDVIEYLIIIGYCIRVSKRDISIIDKKNTPICTITTTALNYIIHSMRLKSATISSVVFWFPAEKHL